MTDTRRALPAFPLLGALFLSCVLLATPARAEPRFADYPAERAFAGKPAAVDLASHPRARTFRTRLRDGAAEGPNFAGHWTVILWGCGTGCQMVALVDARTGRVLMLPFAASRGAEYERDSRLLVVNPGAPDAISDAPTRHFVMKDGKLAELDR